MTFRARRDDARLRNRHRILVLALGAALVVTTGVHDAAARKKKESVVATINGKHRRWRTKKIGVIVSTNPDSVSIIATVKRPHRLNQFIPGVALTCELSLASTFPVTPVFPQLCVLGYSEIRFSRNPNPKMWGGSNFDGTAAVTFDSLVGGRLTGTFSGTLTSQNNPPNPPVSINGTFSIDVGG